jgi:hypothetical protein
MIRILSPLTSPLIGGNEGGAEGKLFDFTGSEFIDSCFLWGLINQFKEDTGKYLKQAIEDCVGFHKNLGKSTLLVTGTIPTAFRKINVTATLIKCQLYSKGAI